MSATVAVIGLNVALGVAPPAAADPCTGAVANAMPPQPVPTPAPQERPVPWPFNQLPLGHKPLNANDNAPNAAPAASLRAKDMKPPQVGHP